MNEGPVSVAHLAVRTAAKFAGTVADELSCSNGSYCRRGLESSISEDDNKADIAAICQIACTSGGFIIRLPFAAADLVKLGGLRLCCRIAGNFAIGLESICLSD